MKRALRSMLALATALAPVMAIIPAAAVAQDKGYAALEKLPDWRGVWSPDWGGLFGPNTPKPPVLTPETKKMKDAYDAKKAQGENLQTRAANCIPSGMPQIMRQPYPIEFAFTPGRVTILHETYSQVRRIYTDGRPLPEDPDAAFNGWSVGHWEGDTLVVDTIGLNPQTSLMDGIHPTENTKIQERIHITAPDTMTVETAITDPALFVGTYNLRTNYIRKPDWVMREYVCEENNHDAADEQGRPSMDISK